jgi:protocatechuate 3,4-dioxygenase beta subunit
MSGHHTPTATAADVEDHDRGLQFDVGTIMSRRRLLAVVAGFGAATLAACGSSASSSSAGAPASTGSTGSTGSTTTVDTTDAVTAETAVAVDREVPDETGGPFPGDGSNGPDVLVQAGVVRSDIRTSFGEYSGSATGVPVTLTMTVLDSSDGFAPLSGAAVYIWHADQAGRYSLYSDGATEQNYLRGVQEADADGTVTFVTNFPSCYDGRWPHIHFEVYPTLAAATSGASPSKTSQMAMPEDVCTAVFATSAYPSSAANLSRVSLERDMVFSDGAELETPTLTGDVTSGYSATYAFAV